MKSSSSSLAALRERFAARALRLGALRFDRFGFGVLRFGGARLLGVVDRPARGVGEDLVRFVDLCR